MGSQERSALTRFFRRWKQLGMQIGEWVSVGFFAVLYVFVFAPVAIGAKLARKRFLPHFPANAPTFFLRKEKIEPTMEYMRRQW